MKVLGVIPARGGSKRVKDKNIRLLGGKPLIAHTIEAAKTATLINRAIVSTDSVEIKEVAERHGAEVPFVRPEELAADASPDRPMLIHALKEAQAIYKEDYDAVALLRPTSPFRTAELIDEVISKLVESEADSIRTMTKCAGVHHPYWMFTSDEKGMSRPFDPSHDIETYYQSGLLPPVYRLNGAVDIIRAATLLGEGGLYGEQMLMHEMDEKTSLDIDTEFDLKMAEFFITQ